MIVGTRGSQLALVQTNFISKCLSDITGTKIEKKIIKTKGDKITTSQLYNMDSKGLFTKELDKVVLEEEVDFAVHSLKDVPTDLDEDLEIAAVPKRESPNEVLISNKSWEELSPGSTLGTSSLRREAFCNYHNKEFELKPIRGNIETRINKVISGELDATIMAHAGLLRLNLTENIKSIFPLDYITPAAGQGALAIITRKDSDKKEEIFKLNDYKSQQCVLAEKSVLKALDVGCQWPIGSIAQIENNKLKLYSILLNQKGEILHQKTIEDSIKNSELIGEKIGRIFEDYV
ncbi:hydroxymethylbilane synthase [Methanobrevibacter sp. OttesenSCG-928-K11]|nr:hydroxymethylbilane synthase [Methanobrevibacter sp. OttesenSCG-928-K11]MDL2270942.1 hydroxymethylbilane synthase [Methanobrevibacter sp. OttesenSCG-928-I08]